MKGRIMAVCRVLAVILTLAALSLASLNRVATDEAYQMGLHRALGSARATGLTDEGLERAVNRLALCIGSGSVKVLSYEDSVYGVSQSVFNAREIAHMRDVAALFALSGRMIGYLMLGACAACGVLIALALRREKQGMTTKWRVSRAARHWGRALAVGVACWAAALGLLAAVAAADFNSAFLAFHRIFFDNDLWLMDPRTDLMIRMMPEAFFTAMAKRVALECALWPAGALVLSLILHGLCARRRKSK